MPALSFALPAPQPVSQSFTGLGAALCLALALPCSAEVLRFDLLALSSLTVRPGETVSFEIQSDYRSYHYAYVVPASAEPGWPYFGEQSWFVGSRNYVDESLANVVLRASSSAGDSLSQSFWRPGSSLGWGFSMSFAAPGSYTVSADGNWDSSYHEYYYSNTLTRFCVFFCGAWEPHVTEYSRDGFFAAGSYPTRQLTVTVVPEPASAALLLAGGLALALARRPRRLS